ncbi:ammonium transporter [Waterburya agarophytonicola K14]|uniref:Ammonium transporter n=1 Tax=Waterburya agarophytonicola KI4 TaxID=2874699 RepID=A0A964BR40_9CYAN|nr:ammonium transporter [Waterburya agarophytonicola]MCC0178099.1 ammonium transporter [Waterburya agarophytonicola KI4]
MNSKFLETKQAFQRRNTVNADNQIKDLIPRPLRTILKSFSPAWLICIPLAAGIVVLWDSAATAQGLDAPATLDELRVVLDSIFLLFCSVLVIFMNAGFGMLEAGFCRQKNAVNILAKNLIVFGIATLAYWAVGYALMYGEGNPFIGLSGFLFNADSAAYGNDAYPAGVPEAISFLFQVAFAATAATIVSGAVAERIKFSAFLIFSTLLVGFSYAITGHWVWDGGWLSEMGFSDFAGSTVVHSVGGWAALVGAAILGPRIGKYQNGRISAIPGHNMGFATLGCLILWIGWFGFNPGSELAATANVPYIAVTTNLAAAAGGVTATFTSWIKDGKPDLSMVINGILAGLVGITAGCADVSYLSAIIIGGIAGIIVVFSVAFFDSIKIDDPVGATSVHLVCGIWGTLAVGIFGTGNIVTQIIGIVAIGAFTVIFSAIVWTLLKVTIGIRVHENEERIGLDISEHGMEAYSGFVKEADVLSSGGSGISVGMNPAETSEF